jgi:hypothetical protein
MMTCLSELLKFYQREGANFVSSGISLHLLLIMLNLCMFCYTFVCQLTDELV